MIQRFIIGVDPMTAEQDSLLRDYLSEKGTWWHWINNMWLFVPEGRQMTVGEINNKIKEINPAARSLVMEIPEDITWSVRAKPNANGGSIGDWLKKQWKYGK